MNFWPEEAIAKAFGLPDRHFRTWQVTGKVVVKYLITEEGAIVDPVVVESTARSSVLDKSLNGLFDTKAIEIVLGHRYPPAPTLCSKLHPISWETEPP
ncbi:MAG: hypothetical protein AAGG55_17025 [Pseudomonadota bacterium]